MKKQLARIAMSAVVVFSATAFSQQAGVQPVADQVSVEPGLVIGPGFFSESQTGSTYNSRTGFLAGGLLDISFNDYLSLRPGLMYSGRGASMSGSYTDEGVLITYTGDLDLNYLAIPIDVKVKIPAAPSFCPYVLAGVNIAFLLNATAKETVTGSEGNVSMTETIDTTITSSFKTLDFGLDLGFGAEFPVGSVIPFVEFSYYLGLTNVAVLEPGEPNLTNHGIELKAGVKFKM